MLSIPLEDLIYCPRSRGAAETRVKGSRFIALCAVANHRDSAQSVVEAEQKKYHDATHHCWAWRELAPGEAAFAWDDNGEPSGTAGAPILKVIDGAALRGVIVVVTRYFGGTKLGTGGLARAYGEAAAAAVENSGIRQGMLAENYAVTLEYPRLGAVNHLMESFPLLVTGREFTDTVGLNIAVASSRAAAFERELTENTAGQARIESLGPRIVFE